YTGMPNSGLNGSLSGISGLDLFVSNASVKSNTSTTTSRLNWATVVFADSSLPTIGLLASDQLRVEADARLNLFGFVVAAGHFTIAKTTATGGGLTGTADALVVAADALEIF